MNEILAYIERDGERFIVVWFPVDAITKAEFGTDDSIEVLADAPYWWRTQGRFIDRAQECSR